MRVAVVHEWFDVKAGSEAVVAEILKIYPDADVYCVVNFLPEKDPMFPRSATFRSSFIQKLPFARKHFRAYLPLMPLAVEQFDLSAYDLIISSSHAVAKGVITGPDQIHVSYVHSPMRYAWDFQGSYLRASGLDRGFRGWIAKLILHYLRLWDVRTANGVDVFVANASFIARRIWKVYRREAEVLHPPVDVSSFALRTQKEDFYLAASRFVPYKKIPMIVEAFAGMPDKKLFVIGEGPDADAARAVAGPNVTFLGYQPREAMVDWMQRAKAFVFAAEEDFGIVPVEAMACGTPVIAYRKGGVTESVIEGKTGVFFDSQTVEGVREGVEAFENSAHSFDPATIRVRAMDFDAARFGAKLKAIVDREIVARQGSTGAA